MLIESGIARTVKESAWRETFLPVDLVEVFQGGYDDNGTDTSNT